MYDVPVEPFEFFKNEKGDIRTTYRINAKEFLVIKIIKGTNDVNSVKFWHGDYDKVVSYWTTKKFMPEPTEWERIIKETSRILNAFIKTVRELRVKTIG